jgi:hypothetical protein
MAMGRFGIDYWLAAAGTAAVVLVGCAANEQSPGSDNPGVGAPTFPGAGGVGAPGATAGTTGGFAGTTAPPINMGMAGNGSTGMPGAGGVMPCEINTLVTRSCQTCHGASPIGGAPMSLVTLADWQKDYTVTTTAQLRGQMMKVYQLAKIRVNGEMGTGRMPQGAALAANDLSTLNSWLTGGALAGSACSATGNGGTGGIATAGTGGMAGGSGGTGGSGVIRNGDQCTGADAYEPLVAMDGETCYDFRSHNNPGANDTSKFSVASGESYSQFYFRIPWPAGALATRFGTDFDNQQVLHHWLMFASHEGRADGDVAKNVTGTTLGTNSELIAGWAVGGCTTVYPEDVGVKLPDAGIIMVQWHHWNNGGGPAQDASAAQICTVPAGARPNTAGLTFLGTENMTVPAGQMADATGTCLNDSGGDITIIGFTPHMHNIGINMKSVVTRAAGGNPETVFDEPFQFDYQTNYMMDPPVVLHAGDRITSTCTYKNEGTGVVRFGQSSTAEMCYQFSVSYPYGALNNGVISLIGATNTCW